MHYCAVRERGAGEKQVALVRVSIYREKKKSSEKEGKKARRKGKRKGDKGIKGGTVAEAEARGPILYYKR